MNRKVEFTLLSVLLAGCSMLMSSCKTNRDNNPPASSNPATTSSSCEVKPSTVRPALVPPKEPLHMAAMLGDVQMVKKLIAEGVDVNKIDERYECTALDLAARFGQLEIVKILRKAGARIYVENPRKEPLVFSAVESGNVEILRFLLSEGASKDSRNADGENLLHHAISARHKEMVLYLIGIGVDVNAKDKAGRTPLHTVAWVGDLPVIGDLVRAGANVNATTNHLLTALHDAVTYDHVQIVADLISARADCNARDESGQHPLFYARSPAAMDILLKAGAKPDMADNFGTTPLAGIVVAEDGVDMASRLIMVSSLIKAGVDVNRRVDHGRSAIFSVIPDDKVEMFQLLVDNGAKLDIKDDSGQTLLDWVWKYNAQKIAAFLKDREGRS